MIRVPCARAKGDYAALATIKGDLILSIYDRSPMRDEASYVTQSRIVLTRETATTLMAALAEWLMHGEKP